MRILIIAMAACLLNVTVSKGEWLTSGVIAVIALVLLFMGHVERTDARAHWNRTRYWAEGGPDRSRTRYRR